MNMVKKLNKKIGRNIALPDGDWEWGGCGDNVHFGLRKSKEFLDSIRYKRRSDIKTLVKLHNNNAGRLHSAIGSRMFTFNMTMEQSSCSFAKSNRLYGIWLAGVNWNDFHQTMQLEDIKVISVPLICQDIMKLTTSTVRSITENVPSKKKNDKKTALSLRELSHLTLGIVKVFEYQVKILYDQVLQGFVQQSRWDLDFDQSSEVSSLRSLRTNNTSLKRKGDASGAKRVKRIKSVSIHFGSVDIIGEDVQDVEVDNETIMKVLRTSIVMNKQEITMREVEDESDTFTQTSEFEAIDHSSMQLFHEIRELVARRLSSDNASHQQNVHEQQFMSDAFKQRNNSTNANKKSKKDHRNVHLINTNVGEHEEDDDDEYDADGFNQEHTEQHDSLPDISIYRPVEEHVEPARENDHSLPDIPIYQPELNENIPCDDNALTDSEMQVDAPISNAPQSIGPNDHHLDVPVQNTSQAVAKVQSHKRKRQFKDTILQVDFNDNYQINTSRCSNPRFDVVSKSGILRAHDSRLFVQPMHMFKNNLKFRDSKDIAFSPKLMIDAKRLVLKRTEETDLEMINDFLGYSRKVPNEAVIKPKAVVQRKEGAIERELQPIRDKDDSAANAVENDSPMLAADISTQIEHPCVEFSNLVEPAPVEAILNESEALDLMPLIEPPNQFHKELPPQILKVLNLSESAKVSDTHWSTDSEKMFIMRNQKNRREWGEKGVMEHLFWLWNNNIYPIGMKELTQSCQSRVAKALAFRSILELNSPRVGLIVIENKPNSNEIYNIAKSEKLNDLLQSI